VKKNLLRSIIVLAMILSILFAPAVRAEDSTKIPWDYLYPEEKTFVTQVRAYVIIAKVKLDAAQTDVDTIVLQDMKAWISSMQTELTALNTAVFDLSQIEPTDNFRDIGEQLRGLSRVNVKFYDVMANTASNFVEFAYTAATINNTLKKVRAELDNLSQSLEKKVRDLGKQRAANEEALGNFITSCMAGESGPP
jgi:hypothetical protein